MNDKPEDWIDKLFDCMSRFYGERWDTLFRKAYAKELAKTIWGNALARVSYNQVKKALFYYRDKAKLTDVRPPSPMEFCDLAVRHLELVKPPEDSPPPVATKEVARKYLAQIKLQLMSPISGVLDGQKAEISIEPHTDSAQSENPLKSI